MPSAGPIPFVATLRQLLAPPAAPLHARCEVCGAAVPARHEHVVDTASRRLLCACPTCATADGPRVPIPRRYVHAGTMTMSRAQWERLQIPVDLVFFFFNSAMARVIACYPGPAGAVESVLPLDEWGDIARAYPWMADIQPDVEAILVRRLDDEYSCFIVPVDTCYELAGRIRQTWAGLGGGEPFRLELDRFFQEIVDKCRDRTAP